VVAGVASDASSFPSGAGSAGCGDASGAGAAEELSGVEVDGWLGAGAGCWSAGAGAGATGAGAAAGGAGAGDVVAVAGWGGRLLLA
jgi:hypothetical protein